jgi:hypothetical protein
MSKIAGGGGPTPPGTSPASGVGGGGMNPEAIGAAVSQEYAGLQNVNPGKILSDLNRIKAELAAMFAPAVLRVGDAGKPISAAIQGVNGAIKAFEKAQEGLQQARPLGLASAQQQPTTGATPFGPQTGPPQ